MEAYCSLRTGSWAKRRSTAPNRLRANSKLLGRFISPLFFNSRTEYLDPSNERLSRKLFSCSDISGSPFEPTPISSISQNRLNVLSMLWSINAQRVVVTGDEGLAITGPQMIHPSTDSTATGLLRISTCVHGYCIGLR
ncbi:hypothetical protein T10_7663 [Trichinella papuae]|uniref:Uncharacterized protein n=1 Tax=Trichinella papuae TaxID=268474 RepID=A0A0V1M086_9BILA|nr:hypothetical protein T10_7663 [Trichinella papuae]